MSRHLAYRAYMFYMSNRTVSEVGLVLFGASDFADEDGRQNSHHLTSFLSQFLL